MQSGNSCRFWLDVVGQLNSMLAPMTRVGEVDSESNSQGSDNRPRMITFE